jgi:hypothetical protein
LQDLEVVVQVQGLLAADGDPLVHRDLPGPVEHGDGAGAESDPDPAADQLRRHRVVALPDRHSGVAVDPRLEG